LSLLLSSTGVGNSGRIGVFVISRALVEHLHSFFFISFHFFISPFVARMVPCRRELYPFFPFNFLFFCFVLCFFFVYELYVCAMDHFVSKVVC